jgi:ABC-type siderophore export system fused ATPase/permease subunit
MSEFISNTFVQISEYSMSVLNAFKTNLLALGGYLFGLVLTVISGGIDILDIFSDTIMKLTIIVLCFSVIYLLISKSEAQHKLNDVQEGYETMKKSYKDILSEDEIKTLTEDDGESIFDKFKTKAQKGMRKWTIIGIGFMIVGIILCSLKLFVF